MTEVLESYKAIVPRLRGVECVLTEFGGAERLTHLYGRVEAIESDVGRAVRGFEESKKAVAVAGQDASQALRSIPHIQESLNHVVANIDSLERQHAQEARDLQRAIRELQRCHIEHERHMSEALHEVQARTERLGKMHDIEHLREMLEELSDRTDGNFKSVEESARAVGAKLSRHATELSAVRSDVASIEERAQNRVLGLSNDMEQRYQMLLEAFREYERNSHDLEEHLVMAGQVLARRKGR